MQFLFDENVHHALISFLAQLGHDVKVPPKGTTNGAVFEMAVAENRILLTHDSDFTNKLFPTTHPGIILMKISSRYLDTMKQSLLTMLAKKKSANDFHGMLILLSEDKIEEFPFSYS